MKGEEIRRSVTTCRNFRSSEGFGRFRKPSPVTFRWWSGAGSHWSDPLWSLPSVPMHDTTWHISGGKLFQWLKYVPIAAFSTIFLKVSHSYAIRLSFRFCRLPNGGLKWYKWWLLTVDNIWTLSKKNSWPSALMSLRYLDTSSTEQDLTLSDTKKDSFQRRFSAAELLTKRFRLDPDGIVHVKRLRLWCHQT